MHKWCIIYHQMRFVAINFALLFFFEEFRLEIENTPASFICEFFTTRVLRVFLVNLFISFVAHAWPARNSENYLYSVVVYSCPWVSDALGECVCLYRRFVYSRR